VHTVLGLLPMIVLLARPIAASGQADKVGHFDRPIQAQFENGGREMRLLRSVTYTDPAGVAWNAPEGFVTDGASIPRVFWSIVGGPFEGPYRSAAVIPGMVTS
jgi:hypothetical protein